MIDFEWLVEDGTRSIPTPASNSHITTSVRTNYTATTPLEPGLVPFGTLLLKIQANWWKIAAAGCEPTLASRRRTRLLQTRRRYQNEMITMKSDEPSGGSTKYISIRSAETSNLLTLAQLLLIVRLEFVAFVKSSPSGKYRVSPQFFMISGPPGLKSPQAHKLMLTFRTPWELFSRNSSGVITMPAPPSTFILITRAYGAGGNSRKNCSRLCFI
jgi:hypothetical protein